MKKLTLLYCLFFLLFATVVSARHIVGGEITYKFVSKSGNTNKYRFTMRIFRDGLSGGARLDGVAQMGIFRKSNNDRVDNFGVSLTSQREVPNNKPPCLNSSQRVVVEEGIYEWETDLPIINDAYIIAYQRCCRNETIGNILNPGRAGATYSVEITARSQELGNSSPTFKSFPPTIICGGFPINFDHSARDDEGDQIVYRFCDPLNGGGLGGSAEGGGGDPRSCNGVSPTPPCFPPNSTINFKIPNYTAARPVGGNPVVQINATTGLITGTPVELQQYVVTVCAEEYRNGQLLSVLRRDFQFNVQSCDPIILAKVKADSVRDNTYYLFQCGSRTLPITNLSLDRSAIEGFVFNIDLKKEKKAFTEWEPMITFPDTGVYQGNLMLNPGTECGDTIFLQMSVYDAVKADFGFTYDTCVAGPVAFRDKSVSANGALTKWRWDFGDGNQSVLQNPSHLYRKPGEKAPKLTIQDLKGCRKDTTLSFRWLPVPPLLLIQPNTFNGCTPADIFFNNLSSPIDSTYKIDWNFGDSTTAQNIISPTHRYEKPGTYSVSVRVTSPIGCSTSKSFNNWIKVNDGVNAAFEYSPERFNTFAKNISLTDKSFPNPSSWQWRIDSIGYSAKQNPTFTLSDTGFHDIQLITRNRFGCADTLVKRVDVEPLSSFWMPNAFTPNGDGLNDEFKGRGYLEGSTGFTLKIWNRWSELVFETNNPSAGWNGRKYNVGVDAPQGVYLCLVTYVEPRGQQRQIRTYATLLR